MDLYFSATAFPEREIRRGAQPFFMCGTCTGDYKASMRFLNGGLIIGTYTLHGCGGAEWWTILTRTYSNLPIRPPTRTLSLPAATPNATTYAELMAAASAARAQSQQGRVEWVQVGT